MALPSNPRLQDGSVITVEAVNAGGSVSVTEAFAWHPVGRVASVMVQV